MAVEIGEPAYRPYAPPSNVLAVLHRLRSRNLPERIDADYLRDVNVPDGTVARTLHALRFLRLIEGDVPTDALRAISTSTDEEYQGILAGLIRGAYTDLFTALDPSQDTQDRIVNFFRRYTPASQRERMVILFLGLCREAGIPTADVPRQRSAASSSRPKALRPGSRSGGRLALPAPKDDRLRGRDSSPDRLPQVTTQGPQPLFGVTEADIALLDDGEFSEVWAALGRVARARARAQRERAERAQTDAQESQEREEGSVSQL